MARDDRSRREAPLLVAVALIGALCFGASNVIAQWGLRELHHATKEITENASPSVQYLAAARGELRGLELELDRCLKEAGGGRRLSTDRLDASRARLRDELEAYLALPVFPNEREIWATVDAELETLDAMIERAVASARAGDRAAVEAASPALGDQFGRVAAGILRSIDFDARHTHDLALRADHVTTWTTQAADALDVLSVCLAAALAVLLVRSARRDNQLLEERNDLLRARADELEMFAGRVAHDILGPLTAVDLALGPRASAALAVPARRSLQRVKTIVDGLLGFARSGARPEPGAVADACAVSGDLLRDLEPLAAESGIALDLAPCERAHVACSAGVLTSLLSNLIRNSIKYMGDAPARRVALRILDRGPAVRFEVEDTGPGLPPDLEKRAFEPYVRGHGHQQPGIGLGLATVKRLAEAHGGAIGLRSNPGAGALFWFELPRAVVPAAVEARP